MSSIKIKLRALWIWSCNSYTNRSMNSTTGRTEVETSQIYLFHGFHRFAATEGGRCYDVLIRLHHPHEGRTAARDAFIRSLDNPAAGGGAKYETQADKRHRIRLALEDSELCALSNVELDKILCVGPQTIQYHRNRLGLFPTNVVTPL